MATQTTSPTNNSRSKKKKNIGMALNVWQIVVLYYTIKTFLIQSKMIDGNFQKLELRVYLPPTSQGATTPKLHPNVTFSLDDFHEVNGRLSKIRDEDCGRKGHTDDCERKYSLDDVIKSAGSSSKPHSEPIQEYMTALRDQKREKAIEGCQKKGGGTMMCVRPKKNGVFVTPDGAEISYTVHQKPPDTGLCKAIASMTMQENVRSISDFGAGLGQTGACVFQQRKKKYSTDKNKDGSSLVFRNYDAIGDIKEYTGGFVQYADFSTPLALPKSDWIISMNTGQWIRPSNEGIFLRNLHAHNCKGIILTWASLTMVGKKYHVNLHSEDYIIKLFTDLGYVHDTSLEGSFRRRAQLESNTETTFVFRRSEPAC